MNKMELGKIGVTVLLRMNKIELGKIHVASAKLLISQAEVLYTSLSKL
jgi:hypothetical protein